MLIVEVWRNEAGSVAKVHEDGSVTYVYGDQALTVAYAKPNRPIYAPAHDKLSQYGYAWVCNQHEAEIPPVGSVGVK
jgi:hypothetical protein